MQWQDEAIILGTRQYGETSAIVEVMSGEHGRHFGVIRGGRSKTMQSILQAGNKVKIVWNARLNEHIGNFKVEIIEFSAARFIETSSALYALQTILAHFRLLAERETHPRLYRLFNVVTKNIDRPRLLAEILVRFELDLLNELGFGLDLTACVLTKKRNNLIYVSPKSGRAVSEEAGKPWHNKLLSLPTFLTSSELRPGSYQDIVQGFLLTGYFLNQYVWHPRNVSAPIAREKFQAKLKLIYDIE